MTAALILAGALVVALLLLFCVLIAYHDLAKQLEHRPVEVVVNGTPSGSDVAEKVRAALAAHHRRGGDPA